FNLGFHYKPNDNNFIDLIAYQSQDIFQIRKDTTYHYGDKNISLKWRHSFSRKLFSKIIISYNQFDNGFHTNANPLQGLQWNTSIKQLNFKTHFDYSVNSKISFTSGLSAIHYHLIPGKIQPYGSNSLVKPDEVQSQDAVESAIYLNGNFEVSPNLSIAGGIRYSSYYYL